MNPKLPSPEEREKIIRCGIDLANEFIPHLGIPEVQYETALKAYVAGFIAGHGAAKGEEIAKRKMN